MTRARVDAAPLLLALRGQGLTPVCVPLLERVFDVRAVRSAWRPSDLVVFTSAAAVQAMVEAQIQPSCPAAAVGPRTAAVAREAGWRVQVQPTRALASELIKALGDLGGKTVFYPRADLAPRAVSHALGTLGADVIDVVAYRNRCPEAAADQLAACTDLSAITLLSGSAAVRLHELWPGPPDGVPVVVIGPSTADAARKVGLPVRAVADPHTVAGVVQAVLHTLR